MASVFQRRHSSAARRLSQLLCPVAVCVSLSLTILLPRPLSATSDESHGRATLPSADELWIALANGDIDYPQYATLLELLDSFSDSALLTEARIGVGIGGGDFLDDSLESAGIDVSIVEPNAESIADSAGGKTGIHSALRGNWKSSSSFNLRDDKSERGRVLGQLSSYSGLSLRIALAREVATGWRFRERSLRITADKGPVTELTLGNFDFRFGLGLAAGRRSRLLSARRNSARVTTTPKKPIAPRSRSDAVP